jgi:hypothetical protein
LTWQWLRFLPTNNHNKLPNPTTAAEETSWLKYHLYSPGTCGKAGNRKTVTSFNQSVSMNSTLPILKNDKTNILCYVMYTTTYNVKEGSEYPGRRDA